MNKLGKTICFLMAVSMLLTFLFTGCGKETSTATATSATENSAAGNTSTAAANSTKETEKQLEPVNLRWILPKIQAQNENGPVFDAANKIITEKVNATIKFDLFEFGDFEKKVNLLIAAGEKADIFYTSNWVNNYYQLVAKGGLTDITDMLSSAAPNLKAKFSDAIWNALKVSGKIYAVPNQSVYVRRLGLEFRKDLVEKYSFDYKSVRKLEDLEPYLKTIKEKEPDVLPIENDKDGGYLNAQNYFGWDTFVSMRIPGVGKNEGELKVFNQFESQEFKDFLKLVRDWYVKGYNPKESATGGGDYRALGKYAVVTDPAAYPGEDAIFSSSQAGGTPYVLNSDMNGDSAIQTGSIASNLNAICKTSKNPERALMVLDLVNSDKELYNILCWGLEGTNYTKQADGTIDQIKNGKYEGVYNFFLGDMLQTYITKGQPLDMYEQMKKLNDSGKPSIFMGFVFDPTPVKSQVTQCTAVTDQYLPGLCSGYLDPEKNYSEFISKIKKAGADEIIAEMQRQVDAWAKAK